MFGLGVLSHLVRSRWASFAPEDRAALARLALDRLREGARATRAPHASSAVPACCITCPNPPSDAVGAREGEPWAIKVKTAALLAEARGTAPREWLLLTQSPQAVRQDGPSLWASLCPELLAGASAGCGHAEMACLVLRTLAEDVTVYNEDLDGAVMRALLSALTATLPDTLPCLYRLLQVHIPQASGEAGSRAAASAASAALAAAAAHAEWAPLAALARSGLLSAACALLPVKAFRLAAVDILRAVAGRRITDAEDERPACHASMDSCAAALAVAAGALGFAAGEDASDTLEFGARLCDALATHAAVHLPRAPQGRAELLGGLMVLTRHASLRVSQPAWTCWMALLRQAGAPVQGALSTVQSPPKPTPQAPSQGAASASQPLELPPGALPALAEAVAERLAAGGGFAGGCDPFIPPVVSAWEEEFDSPEELREAWLLLRSHAMSVARMCCALAPQEVTSIAAQRIAAACALASAAAGEAGAPAQGGWAASGALEGAVSFLEAALAGAHDTALAAGGPAAAAAERCLSALLAVPGGRSPGVALQQARGLEACARVAASRQEAATQMLASLFGTLEGLPGGGSAASPPSSLTVAAQPRGAREASAVARQRVCSAVLGVAAGAGAALRPHLAPLAEKLGALSLRGTERGTLAEALLTVSQAPAGGAGEAEGARGVDCLGWLLAPVAARWEAAPPQAQLQPRALLQPSWQLFDDIQLLERCLRRMLLACAGTQPTAQPPFLAALAQHARWALPHLLRVLQAVHGLWTPAGRAQLSALAPDFHKCLDISPEEVQLYTGARDGAATPTKQSPPQLSGPDALAVDAARGFLRGVRDSSYGLLAICLPGLPQSGPPGAPGALPPGELYAAPGLPTALGAALLDDLESMELRHVRQLVKTLLQPLLARTPPGMRIEWCSALLPRLLPHMQGRLIGAWALHKPLASDGDVAAEAATAEVISDRLLRDGTRAHAAFLAGLVSGFEPPQPGWATLPAEAAALHAGAATAAAALTWPDGEAAAKGAAVCRALAASSADGAAPALPACSPAWGEVLSAALRALTLPSNVPHAVDLLSLARDLTLKLGGAQATTQPVLVVLAALPGVGADAAAQLVAELRAMRSERDQRARLKAFLLAAAGGSLAAFAADGIARPAASAVTVTRLGPPADRRAKGRGAGGGGFGAMQPPDAEGGALGLAAFGA